MYICTLKHRNGTVGVFSRPNSILWELRLEDGKVARATNLLDHVLKDVKDGTLTVIDGTLPVVHES